MGIIKYRKDASSPWVDIPALQGETPVKGEDYFTEEEISSIVEQVAEYQNLDGYATKKYVDDAVESIPEYDLSVFALRNEIPDISNLATKLYVQLEIAKNGAGGSDVDLSDYATKEYVEELLGVIENGTY